MRRKPDRPDAGRPEEGVKLPRVLAVAVVDEMRRVPQRAVKAGDVPRLLRRPFRIRMRRRANDDDPARPDVDEEEDVVGDKPAGCPDVGGEEVRRPQTGVCPQKLRPRHSAVSPLLHGMDAVLVKYAGDGGGGKFNAVLPQFADDPVIAPGRVLLRHPHDRLDNPLVDCGASPAAPSGAGAVVQGGDHPALPSEDGVRLDDGHDVAHPPAERQRLPDQTPPHPVGEPWPLSQPLQLLPVDVNLRLQVLVLLQKLLVEVNMGDLHKKTQDVPPKTLPHFRHLPAFVALMPLKSVYQIVPDASQISETRDIA